MTRVAVDARIASVGLTCPVGLTAKAAIAAVEAGVTRFELVDAVLDPTAQPVSASRLSSLGERRLDRAASLAVAAIRDALEPLDASSFPDPIPCLLASGHPTAGGDLDPGALALEIRRGLGDHPVELAWPSKPTTMRGRAAFFEALESAVALIAIGKPAVVVGATDSLADEASLSDAARTNRVISKRNLDGNIYGEAAAFVLLVHPHHVHARSSLGSVFSLAKATEPRPITNPEPSTALGLADLFRQLRATHPQRLGAVYNGISCEGFYGMEFSNAYLRNNALMPEPLRNHVVGNAFGDVGAAAGAVAFVQAVAALKPRRGPAVQTALAYGSSDDGGVGGCIVKR